MKTQYIVKFSKYFLTGNLKGLMVDCKVSFPNLETATEYVAYTIRHTKKPVWANRRDSFTTHMGRIETITINEQLTKENEK